MTPTPDLDISGCTPIVSLRNQLKSKWNLVFSTNTTTAWISFKPQLGFQVYPCYSCRDMFISNVTFQDHINRRAIVIKYDCSKCNQTLTFYNRCSFLLHARSHFSLTEGKIDLNKIEIYNLPFGTMGFLPHPGIKLLFDEDADSIEDDCYINAQFYSPDTSDKGKQIITLKPDDLIFCATSENSVNIQLTLKQISSNIPLCEFVTMDCQRKLRDNFIHSENLTTVKEELMGYVDNPDYVDNLDYVDNAGRCSPLPLEVSIHMPAISNIESSNATTDMSTYSKCPECKETQKYPMKLHFSGKNIPIDEKLQCSLCKYVSATKCSYLAHERIHSNISPFICPECGKKFESREYLMKHLDEVCFHLAKQVRIRCPGKRCGKLFATPTTFTVHFAQHMITWLQCGVCKECFESLEAFSEHAKVHSNNCYSDQVFKCNGCKFEGLIHQDNVRQHYYYHARDRSRYSYVYVCKFCRNFFRSTTTYAAHLLKCQKMQIVRQQVDSYAIDLCTRCHTRIISYNNENLVTCSKCRHVNSFHPNQKRSTPSTTSNIQPTNQKNSLDKVICLLCKEEYVINQKEEHLSECTYGNPQVSLKKLEDEISHSLITISNNRNDSDTESDVNPERKSSSESDIKEISMEGTDTNESSKSASKTVSPNSQEGFKRKRKRASLVFRSKKVILSSPPENIVDLQAEEPQLFDGTYYCKLCDFQDTERDKFHLHIMNHRDISTDYQCMECGECFVVKPSLIKHLRHYHKIEDTNIYFESNDCYDKNAVENLKKIMKLAPGESREPVQENQCRVCLQQFTDDQELKKHFRSHGMAFLMRNSRDGV